MHTDKQILFVEVIHIRKFKSIARVWKQLKCPSASEWIKKLWHIHIMEYYVALKKKEHLPFATAWMDLESIGLSEISQSEKDRYHMISLICGI